MSRQASRGQMSTAYGSVLDVWGLTLTYAVEVRPSSIIVFRISVRCFRFSKDFPSTFSVRLCSV